MTNESDDKPMIERLPNSKIFISWSDDSLPYATILDDWIQTVLNVETFFSPDIPKGTFWSQEMTGHLSRLNLGIMCITRTNHNQPWLHFEAGALSKNIDKGRVFPILFEGMKPTDLNNPLSLFQLTEFNREDIFKLVVNINSAIPNPIKKIREHFTTYWPVLEEKIHGIKPRDSAEEVKNQPVRDDRDVLNEILNLTRQLASGIEYRPAKPPLREINFEGFFYVVAISSNLLNDDLFIEAFRDFSETHNAVVQELKSPNLFDLAVVKIESIDELDSCLQYENTQDLMIFYTNDSKVLKFLKRRFGNRAMYEVLFKPTAEDLVRAMNKMRGVF